MKDRRVFRDYSPSGETLSKSNNLLGKLKQQILLDQQSGKLNSSITTSVGSPKCRALP
jgi:hypothetical protein